MTAETPELPNPRGGPACGTGLDWRPPELPANPSDSLGGSGSFTSGGTWLCLFLSEAQP